MGSSNLPQILLIFKTPCYNLKIKGLGAKVYGFSIILILKVLRCFEVKESMLLVERKY